MQKGEIMTGQQKQYIVSLRLYELAEGEGGSRKSVTKKFWARLMDKNWQTANTKQLQGLVDNGYLQKIIGGNNTAFYSLTKKAVLAADKCIHNAHAYEWDVHQEQLLEVEIFQTETKATG